MIVLYIFSLNVEVVYFIVWIKETVFRFVSSQRTQETPFNIGKLKISCSRNTHIESDTSTRVQTTTWGNAHSTHALFNSAALIVCVYIVFICCTYTHWKHFSPQIRCVLLRDDWFPSTCITRQLVFTYLYSLGGAFSTEFYWKKRQAISLCVARFSVFPRFCASFKPFPCVYFFVCGLGCLLCCCCCCFLCVVWSLKHFVFPNLIPN